MPVTREILRGAPRDLLEPPQLRPPRRLVHRAQLPHQAVLEARGQLCLPRLPVLRAQRPLDQVGAEARR